VHPIKTRFSFALELARSFRVRPDLTATGRAGSSSHGVRSPSATSAREARFPRAFHTRHLPTSGFRTLLPVSFLSNLPALFHAGAAHGVSLQGFFPSQSLSSLFVRSDLPGVRVVSEHGRLPRRAPIRAAAFKALLSARIRYLRKWGEPLSKAVALLVFGPLRISPSRQPDASAGSPRELRIRRDDQINRETAPKPALQGLDCREVGLSLSRLPPFLAFRTFFPNRKFRVPSRRAYRFTPLLRYRYQSLT